MATDINPTAVKNAQLNAQKHGLAISVRLGNLYEPIGKDEQFDVIFWNHPFNNWGEKVDDVLLKAGFDYNYQALEGYIAGAAAHLAPGGRLLLGTGNFADLATIEKLTSKHGYAMALVRQTKLPIEPGSELLNEYLIYELKRPAL